MTRGYQPRHAAVRPVRPRAAKILLAAGLSTALGVPLATAASAAPVTTAVVTATSTSAPTLRVGSHGAAVVRLQRLLRITADGAFGPRTRRAVVAYQRSHSLTADGIVGPRTWRALGVAASRTPSVSRSYARTSIGDRLVAVAAAQRGKPYRYGANGPNSFDCSGFVQYVHSRVGIRVPRTSGAQAAAARRVSKADKRPGDLIIMYSGGRVSHVGLYAGGGSMWVARHTGTTITRQALWSSYSVGRLY